METRPCLNCNSIFKPRRTSNIYCSRACQIQHLRKTKKIKDKPKQGVICKCDMCHQNFYVPQYRKNTAKYCSRRCVALGNPENLKKAQQNSPIMARAAAMKGNDTPRRYKQIYVNGKQVREHRWIMEQYLGRKLESWEHVHHIDGNHLNNAIENLAVLSNAEHQKEELKQWKKLKE